MYYLCIAVCILVDNLAWAQIAWNVYIISSSLLPERFVTCI
jgi:hypothetical protein